MCSHWHFYKEHQRTLPYPCKCKRRLALVYDSLVRQQPKDVYKTSYDSSKSNCLSATTVGLLQPTLVDPYSLQKSNRDLAVSRKKET